LKRGNNTLKRQPVCCVQKCPSNFAVQWCC